MARRRVTLQIVVDVFEDGDIATDETGGGYSGGYNLVTTDEHEIEGYVQSLTITNTEELS